MVILISIDCSRMFNWWYLINKIHRNIYCKYSINTSQAFFMSPCINENWYQINAKGMRLLKDEFFDELNTSITCSLDQEDVHILLLKIHWKSIKLVTDWKENRHLSTSHPALSDFDRDSYKSVLKCWTSFSDLLKDRLTMLNRYFNGYWSITRILAAFSGLEMALLLTWRTLHKIP